MKNLSTWLKWGIGFLTFYIVLLIASFLFAAAQPPESWNGFGALLIATFPGNLVFEGILTTIIPSTLAYFIFGSLIGAIKQTIKK